MCHQQTMSRILKTPISLFLFHSVYTKKQILNICNGREHKTWRNETVVYHNIPYRTIKCYSRWPFNYLSIYHPTWQPISESKQNFDHCIKSSTGTTTQYSIFKKLREKESERIVWIFKIIRGCVGVGVHLDAMGESVNSCCPSWRWVLGLRVEGEP